MSLCVRTNRQLTWSINMSTTKQSSDKIELSELRSAIDRADQLYYTQGRKSTISDNDYELMKSRLRLLDPYDCRLVRVGVPYTQDELRTKEEHKMPMGSLDNTPHGIAGFRAWYQSLCEKVGLPAIDLVVSLKMDGVSAGADYKDGSLQRILSRGNGVVGDNITANGILWSGLPSTIPTSTDLSVRGEVILSKEQFAELNKDGEYENPRNLCSGIVGRDTGEDNEHLSFYAFNLHESNLKTLGNRYKVLAAMGFQVVQHKLFTGSFEEIVSGVETMFMQLETTTNGGGGGRSELQFEIDGLVVCVDNLELQKQLTETDQDLLRPKHSTAVKFATYKAITKVVDCVITLGHTGALKPKAILDPVRIGGVTVSGVLLNNWNPDSIHPSAAHVAIGDEVEVELAGDIIPKITAVVKECEVGRVTIPEPKEWGGRPTTHINRGKHTVETYVTMDENSPEIKQQKVKHYIGSSKKGVGILGIGDGVLVALTSPDENGRVLVETPADLYRLTLDDLQNLNIGTNNSGKPIRFGKSRAIDLLAEIEKSKHITLPKLLGALGIDLLGTRRVKNIMDEQGLTSLEDWFNDDKLNTIPGDVVRKSIADGLKQSRQLIDDLLSLGVTITDSKQVVNVTSTKEATTASDKFVGKTFCFTKTRECLEEVEVRGGIIKSGVSKGLHYLVQKDAMAQTNKTTKAEELGVKIISIDCLKECLRGSRELPDA